jgi:hypothetical protein
MAKAKKGNPKIDIEFIKAERAYMKFFTHKGRQNISFPVASIALRGLKKAYWSTTRATYTHFIQSKKRREQFLRQDRKNLDKEFGKDVIDAVIRHAKPHQLPVWAKYSEARTN